jgi:hypothetical protein
VKEKLSCYHHAGNKERKYSSYSFLTLALDWVSGQHHALAVLNPREKDPQHPLDRRLGGAHSWSGHRGYMKNPLPLPEIEPQLPGHQVCSRILYWLSYPSSYSTNVSVYFNRLLKCERGHGLFLGTIPADKENTKEQVMLSKCLETWPLSLYYSMSLHTFAKSTANWHACSSYTKFTLPMGQKNVTVPLRGSATLPQMAHYATSVAWLVCAEYSCSKETRCQTPIAACNTNVREIKCASIDRNKSHTES